MFTSRTRASLAACATLAALGLAAAPAAHAQGLLLRSGDIVTVSGAGTVGTLGGAPVANATTSYSNSSGAVVYTSSTAAFTLGTGGTLAAGSGSGLYATGSGPLTITGGSITADSGTGVSLINGSSPLTITGGSITTGSGTGLDVQGSNPVTIMGGSITAGDNGTGLIAEGRGTITVTGGSITAGTGGYDLVSYGNPIDLYGMFDNYALGNTALASSGATGTFFGTLTNNTAPQTFTYLNYGTITLHNLAPAAAPEPSQFAAFGIGLLGLGALALKAKKRQVA